MQVSTSHWGSPWGVHSIPVLVDPDVEASPWLPPVPSVVEVVEASDSELTLVVSPALGPELLVSESLLDFEGRSTQLGSARSRGTIRRTIRVKLRDGSALATLDGVVTVMLMVMVMVLLGAA